MSDFNLIPADRLESSYRKARLRMWIVPLGAYLIVLVAASLAIKVFWSAPGLIVGSNEVRKSISETKQYIEQYKSEIVSLREELAERTAELETTKVLDSQPDWSKLFILLGNELGEEIVLNYCQLESLFSVGSPEDKGDKNSKDSASRYVGQHPFLSSAGKTWGLSLAGFGCTQSSVSQFVLRLEQMNIFKQVRLVDSHRQSFLGEDALAFTIECRL
jgi:hypothetical protein